MIHFANWTTANWIAFASLLISIGTAILLVKNFIQGQKQTKTSLAINQFNIFDDELKGFIDEARNMKFSASFKEGVKSWITKTDLDKANGINYINLFIVTTSHHEKLSASDENEFRYRILFPLERFYDKLYHFLKLIIQDPILLSHYKNILFNRVERDLLQSYLRICNNNFDGKNNYALASFKTVKYNPETFYRINTLFIEKNIFQYKNLEHYTDSL